MHFKAFHGYYAEEQKIGGEYKIDCELRVNIEAALTSDALEDTVDYEKIYAICRNEMQKPQKLIESVAYSLAAAIKNHDSKIEAIELTIHKLNPPIVGHMEKASCTIVL